jgi:hypothetical protein
MKTIGKSVATGLLLASTTLAGFGAVTISPTTGVLNTSRWQGVTGPGQTEINASLNGIISGVTGLELYKQNEGGSEEGTLSGSYTTSFSSPGGSGDGASAGQIVYNGPGNIVGPNSYMLVKDGNASPIWYFYNLTALGWDGEETLDLSGFWLNTGGAISHVTLYGVSTTPGTGGVPGVPDGGTTLVLLGGSLLGVGSLRRLMLKKS